MRLTMRLFFLSLILMLAACNDQELTQQSIAETANGEVTEVQSDTLTTETVRLNDWFDEQYAEQLQLSNSINAWAINPITTV